MISRKYSNVSKEFLLGDDHLRLVSKKTYWQVRLTMRYAVLELRPSSRQVMHGIFHSPALNRRNAEALFDHLHREMLKLVVLDRQLSLAEIEKVPTDLGFNWQWHN